MQSAAAKTVKPNTSKANFRDQRYALPSLLVDLPTGVSETGLWSAGQMALRDVPDDLSLDERGHRLAVKFQDLPPHTFGLPETAIRTSNAT